MKGWQQTLNGLGLLFLLSGCSALQQTASTEQSARDGYCLRAGEQQAYDCSAPALDPRQVRDPLQPNSQFSDEELFSLLAEVKRWLKRERLRAEGKPIPPELEDQEPSSPTPPETGPVAETPLWPRVLDSLSR